VFRNMLTMFLRTILPILIGTSIYAFGLHMFLIPNHFMEGGVTGVAILLNYTFGFAPSVTTLVLNVPLFIIGWRLIGRRAIYYSLFGTLALSFFLWIMEMFIEKQMIVPFSTDQDLLLASLYAGAFIGAGLGIVFRFGGTTGGSDILARVGYKLKGWPMGRSLLWIDTCVIGLSVFYLPWDKLLYTLIIVFVAAKIIDIIQQGAYAAKAFTVITENGTKIADFVTREIDRGVTLLPAKGAFSNTKKEIVYCVVSRQEVRRLQTMIQALDPKAFMIISEVQDVLGEGFRREHR
jgi:uncharacterized membrane-anchored protein YitT (DUF2179 family)